jgi:pimeloyl-ACP methyl ester carboxylesterase
MEWEKTLRRHKAESEDGTVISYEVLGEGENTILLANGLGGRLYAWEPLIEAFWRTHRIITWDYRGLFDSAMPASSRRLAVNNHVEDAEAILRTEKVGRAVLVGWSMGVQVSLDLAATHPDLVGGLVLINGTHGHVLQTGFQPIFAVPSLPKRLHAIIEFLHARPGATKTLATLTRLFELPSAAMLSLTAGPQAFRVRPLMKRYFEDDLGPSFPNYMRLFQELDAHSVYHLLPYIEAPALVVSGTFDALTPAFQSHEIAKRLPNAEHLALFRASHFALLERPKVVIPAIRRFLDERAIWGVPS